MVINLMCLLMAVNLQTGEGYTIKGHIDGAEGKKIYMYRNTGVSSPTDSTQIVNGKFTFTGKLEHPQQASIYMKNKASLSFFVDAGETNVFIKPDSVAYAKVAGGATQASYERYKKATAEISRRSDELFVALQKDGGKRDSLLGVFEKLQQQEYGVILPAFIKQYPDSYVSLYKLREMVRFSSLATLDSLAARLSPKLLTSAVGVALQQELATIRRVEPGQAALHFSSKTPEGKTISTADYKGSYLLVDFWASWCKPCRDENPELKRIYEKFSDKNFKILGVSFDKDSLAWTKAIADDGLTWDHVSDLRIWKNEAAGLYNIKAIPDNILIGPDGKIIAKTLHGKELEEKLKTLFQ